MAQPKLVTVDFHEAYLSDFQPDRSYFMEAVTYPSLSQGPQATYTFLASSAAEVIKHVEALALEHGKSCGAFVRMTNRKERKFPGFDAATGRLTYNLTLEPMEAAS